jgi:hypothetical protein
MPGYILTFDLSFVPHPHLPKSVDNLYPYDAILHYLSFVIPSQVIEKATLLGILLSSSLGAHYLVRYLIKSENPWPPLFAGVFYMINPFTYDRSLDGQYLVLIGYALIPIFTLYLFKFLDRPSLKSIILPILIFLILSITSIHSILFAILIIFVSSIAALWVRQYDHSYQLNFLKGSLFALIIVIIASAYWIVPFFQGNASTAKEIGTFDERQLLTFQTVADHTYNLPASLNPLTLYGYWGEDQDRFSLPKDHMPVWGLIFICILIMTVAGIIGYWKKERGRVVTFLALIILGWILAVGIADPPFSYINGWLYDHVPLFRGYREPQKFIGLIAFGYSVLSALGLNYILSKTDPWKDETLKTLRSVLIAIVLFLPTLYTPTMIWGFAGQLRADNYPSDWYSVNDRLNSDPESFQALFLPWHHYMYFNFAKRVVSNPASEFFDKPVIVSTSDELGLIPSNVETSQTAFIEKKVLPANRQDLGGKLNNIHIKYVILAKDADWESYSWLDKSPDLKLIKEGSSLRFYQNLKYVP